MSGTGHCAWFSAGLEIWAQWRIASMFHNTFSQGASAISCLVLRSYHLSIFSSKVWIKMNEL
jgi:hypothetical protein